MFIIGTGNIVPLIPPIYWYSSIPREIAVAFATASDTPSVAFAPKFDLFNVSSNSISSSSIFLWLYAFIPIIFLAIFLFTFSTAFSTPFPIYLVLSLSRNSTASKLPVDAPDGTIATPNEPSSNKTSTCTVGFPLESSTSNAFTFSIDKKLFIFSHLFLKFSFIRLCKFYNFIPFYDAFLFLNSSAYFKLTSLISPAEILAISFTVSCSFNNLIFVLVLSLTTFLLIK